MKLTIETILTSAEDPSFGEALRTATALDISIDEGDILRDFNGAFNLVKCSLAFNTTIESIKLVIDSEEDTPLVPLIQACFLALESITVSIKSLHLRLTCYAFEEDVINPEITNPVVTMMRVLKNSPAFQKLDVFILENEDTREPTCDVFWSEIFVDIFEAVPKSSLNALTISGSNIEFFSFFAENEEDRAREYNDLSKRLLDTIETSTRLKQLSIEGNYIPEFVWGRLGEFISDHQSLTRVSLNAKGSTVNFDFLIDVLENDRLNDIALMLDGSDDALASQDYVTPLFDISNKLKRLVGLSKLTLDISLDYIHPYWISTLLIAVLKNPTLRTLNICLPPPPFVMEEILIESLQKNKSLTSVSHTYRDNPLLANAFTKQTNINVTRQAHLMPLFFRPLPNTAEDATRPVYSLNELIGAHTVWLSLMALYALMSVPDDLNRAISKGEIVTKTVLQFFLLSKWNINEDLSRCIGEYLTISDISKLSRLTGGCFFREKKVPIVVDAASLDQFDCNFEMFDSSVDFFSDPEAEADDVRACKRQKNS